MSGESPMGKKHPSEPVTSYDKVMSARHKEHRKAVDKMRESPEKYEKSVVFNRAHMREHQEALIKSKAHLKMLKKQAKAASKMGR
jgi:peptidoglycan hydrolase CwlO-like protein